MKHRGFSTLELLVVLICMATLTGVAVATYTRYTDSVARDAAGEVLRDIGQRAQSIAEIENDGKFTLGAVEKVVRRTAPGSADRFVPVAGPSLDYGSVSLDVDIDGSTFTVAMLSQRGDCVTATVTPRSVVIPEGTDDTVCSSS